MLVLQQTGEHFGIFQPSCVGTSTLAEHLYRRDCLIEAMRVSFRYAHFLVTSGGVSMGEKDLMKDVLINDLGFKVCCMFSLLFDHVCFMDAFVDPFWSSLDETRPSDNVCNRSNRWRDEICLRVARFLCLLSVKKSKIFQGKHIAFRQSCFELGGRAAVCSALAEKGRWADENFPE